MPRTTWRTASGRPWSLASAQIPPKVYGFCSRVSITTVNGVGGGSSGLGRRRGMATPSHQKVRTRPLSYAPLLHPLPDLLLYRLPRASGLCVGRVLAGDGSRFLVCAGLLPVSWSREYGSRRE